MNPFLHFILVFATFCCALKAEISESSPNSFTVTQQVQIAASPDTVWNAFTGDISGWWDHSFSGHPTKLYLEAKPGGGFIELFDDQGNGVKHGTVIFVKKPEKLNFEGPLPFNGLAINMVHQVTLVAQPDGGTVVKVVVNAFGKIAESWPAAVDGVWHHFLVERLKPYVEGSLVSP